MLRSAHLLFITCFALLICSLLALPAPADDISQAGKQIADNWQNAVVTLQMTAKISMSYEGEEGSKRESKHEARGTIIDPSGLVVVSMSDVSPDEAYEEMMGDEEEGFSVSAELTDVKILLSDGQELPAAVVLRDKDLDLAFIRPKQKPAKPLTAADLTKAAKPGLLDQAVFLSRQGVAAGRTLSVSVCRIESLVEKPRTFYIPDAESSMGIPAFAIDGSIIGITVLRKAPAGSGNSDSWYENLMQIIMPAADVLEASKQAPATADAT